MRTVILILVLSATPAIAYAHSGAVLRVAVNYIPMLLALIPVVWEPIYKLFNRMRSKRGNPKPK